MCIFNKSMEIIFKKTAKSYFWQHIKYSWSQQQQCGCSSCSECFHIHYKQAMTTICGNRYSEIK